MYYFAYLPLPKTLSLQTVGSFQLESRFYGFAFTGRAVLGGKHLSSSFCTRHVRSWPGPCVGICPRA